VVPDGKLLVLIVATFVVALGVAAVSPFASVMIFFAGCYGLAAYGHARQKKLRSGQPAPPVLPRATLVERDRHITGQAGDR
jgi:hypothetical protein